MPIARVGQVNAPAKRSAPLLGRHTLAPRLSRLLPRALLLAAFLALAAPQAASAVVEVEVNGKLGGFVVFADDGQPNELQVTLRGPEVVLTDASPGASIIYEQSPDFYSSSCSGHGTAEITCPRERPLDDVIGLLPLLDSGDTFDSGPPGCDRERGFWIGSTFSFRFVTVEDATLWGTSRPDEIGAVGKATVYGCGGNDLVEDDSFIGSGLRGGTVHGGAGNDELWARYRSTVKGDAGRDDLFVDRQGVAYGGSGRDYLDVGPGSVARGGGGNDSLYDGRGRSRLFGEGGNDTLGVKTCNGAGKGHDLLSGGAGKDGLHAGCRSKKADSSVPAFVPLGRYRWLPTQSDRLICGSGHDKAMAGRNSRLRGCESKDWLPKYVFVG